MTLFEAAANTAKEITEVTFGGIDKVFNVSSEFIDFSGMGFDYSIKWYGVIIAFGFTLAVLFGGRKAYVWKMDLNKMIDVLIYGAFSGIVGARLYFCLCDAEKFDYYIHNPLEILKIWEGGLAIYGGIIGGIIAAFIVCKVEKLNFYNLLDLAGMSLLIGQGIGRWGNYANQEAFGGFSEGFGMRSAKVYEYIANNHEAFGLTQRMSASAVEEYMLANNLYVHPTFFYESAWCLLGFLLLYIMCQRCRKFSGQIFLSYGIWYGLERMIVEGMRTDSLFIADTSIRASQLLSAIIVAVCAVLMIIFMTKAIKNPKPIEGVDYFIEPVPLLKKNREKLEKEKAEKLSESKEESTDVHKD